MQSFLPLITGGAGALVVLSLWVYAFFTGKLHSDREFSKLETENDQLRTAVANAESNPNLRWSGDDLYISAVYVDEGPTLKRWQQRARGRVNQILKRSCHITIKLEQTEKPTPGKGGPATETKRRRVRRKKEVAA